MQMLTMVPPIVLFSQTESPQELIGNNLVLRNSQNPDQKRSVNKLPDASIHTPICHNHSFLPSRTNRVFADWRLVTLKGLHIDGHFASFGQLKTKFNMLNSHFFRYFQICHYVKGAFPNFETMPISCPSHDLLLLPPTPGT